MSFRDTLQKHLAPELFNQVIDELGDDFNFDLVPRSRLNKVIKQRDEARTAGLGGKQLPKPNPKSKKHDDDDDDDDDDDPLGGVNIEELRQQFEAESDKKVKGVKIQYAALEKLRAAEVVDPDLLWSSSAIDKSKLDLDDAGNLTGLDDQITNLKTAKPHVFKPQKNKGKNDGVPGGTGKNGGEGNEGVTTLEEFMKLDVDKQIAFKQSNPTLFKQFMSTI